METTRVDDFVVQGVTGKVRNDDPAGIGALWNDFGKRELHKVVTEKLSDDIICVYHDYVGTHTDPYFMTIGFRVLASAADIADLAKVNIPAQTAAIFEAIGPQPDALVSQWKSIWETPLNRAYIADYDVHDSANPDRVIVHVGIKN